MSDRLANKFLLLEIRPSCCKLSLLIQFPISQDPHLYDESSFPSKIKTFTHFRLHSLTFFCEGDMIDPDGATDIAIKFVSLIPPDSHLSTL